MMKKQRNLYALLLLLSTPSFSHNALADITAPTPPVAVDAQGDVIVRRNLSTAPDLSAALAEYKRLKSKINEIKTNILAVNLAINLSYYTPQEIKSIFNYDYTNSPQLPEGKKSLQIKALREALDKQLTISNDQTRAQIKDLIKAEELKLFSDDYRISRFAMEHARILLGKQVSFTDVEGNTTGSKTVEYTFAGLVKTKLDAAGDFVSGKIDPTRIFPRVIPFNPEISGGTAHTNVTSPDGYLIGRNGQTEFMMYDLVTHADLAYTTYMEEDKLYNVKEFDTDTDDQYGIMGKPLVTRSRGQIQPIQYGLVSKLRQAQFNVFSAITDQYRQSTPPLIFLQNLLYQYSSKTFTQDQVKMLQSSLFDQSPFSHRPEPIKRSIWTLYSTVRQKNTNSPQWIEQYFKKIIKQQGKELDPLDNDSSDQVNDDSKNYFE